MNVGVADTPYLDAKSLPSPTPSSISTKQTPREAYWELYSSAIVS
jgi:hypothetical protein